MVLLAAAGEFLAVQGNSAQRMLFLVHGSAEVTMDDHMVELIAAGDHFNDPAILIVPPESRLPPELVQQLDQAQLNRLKLLPYLWSVRCLTDCVVACLDGERFKQAISSMPEVSTVY